MRCQNCGFENMEGMTFCNQCANPLANPCPQCGLANPAQARFCGKCATPLMGPIPTISKAETAWQPADLYAQGVRDEDLSFQPKEPEYRQITVMFCDLVGSTAIATDLDPEELRAVVRSYQAVCFEVIQRFGGHIAQYLGDGLLVYFGYPLAHEDDAQRAGHAGLEIIEAMKQLNGRPEQEWGLRLGVRLGIHTGLVVVGEMGAGGRYEQLAIGETPILAARLQGLADPDTVVVSEATYRLIQGFFICQELGAHIVKGVSRSIRLYRLLAESGIKSRLDVTASSNMTLQVGREVESALLLDRWKQAREGLKQVVLLSGEPGIGKSHLVQVMKERLEGELYTILECRCSPYHQNSALYPVIDLLQRWLGVSGEDSPQVRLSKLETALEQYNLNNSEAVPLLAGLLSVPLDDRYPPLNLDAGRRRQKTLEILLAMLLGTTAQRPVLLIMEDLHWVDPSTLELLNMIIVQGQGSRIFVLILLTFRHDFYPPWIGRSHLSYIDLNRLSLRQAEEMVEVVAKGKKLPAEVVEQIVRRTDGIPLFIEETTKAIMESGLLQETGNSYELTGPLPPSAIPATLRDALMARLDLLGTAKSVGQLGATIGREFSYELLQAVSSLDEATLQRELRRLVDAELLGQRGFMPKATYIFRHALIQDTAYQSLLRRTRQQYHQRVAQVLADRFPETAEAQPELLAYHYTEAGLVEQASPYWHKAGQGALMRAAFVEAVNHLTKGLELLHTLPDSPERDRQELDLQIALGPALQASKGYAAPEVDRAYARARMLCQQVGDTPQLVSVLRGQWWYYQARADYLAALGLGEQLSTLAESAQDSSYQLEAHRVLGSNLLFLGEFAQAYTHLEQGFALYNPEQHRSHAFRYGTDPGVGCLSYEARALWFLGYPDQALQLSYQSLTLAETLSHSHTTAQALGMLAVLHQVRREIRPALEWSEKTIAYCTEYGIPYWLALAGILRGWALTEQGQGEEGIVQMHQSLSAYQSTGAKLGWSWFLVLLAEAYSKTGQIEEGLQALNEALEHADDNKERYYNAEIQRLKGELLLMQGGVEVVAIAEAYFRRSLAIARGQSAKSLELRAATSLARLWRAQGRVEQARELLAGVYGWFTEGFNTPDLQEASGMLKELAAVL